MIATRAGVRRVDADGIALWGLGDRAIDVLFDGRRVWSFWLERDTRTTVPGVWSVGWPGALTKFLDGQTRLTVTEHVTGRVLFDQELSFGTATKRIEIVGRSGAPISLDKSGRISPTFDTRSAADVEPLLNAIQTVLDAIASAGIDAFLAYGTLLGAVREKRFLGHDSDADLAYVSESGNPCDVVRESFRLQRVDPRARVPHLPLQRCCLPRRRRRGRRRGAWARRLRRLLDESPQGQPPLPDGGGRRRLPPGVGLPD